MRRPPVLGGLQFVAGHLKELKFARLLVATEIVVFGIRNERNPHLRIEIRVPAIWRPRIPVPKVKFGWEPDALPRLFYHLNRVRFKRVCNTEAGPKNLLKKWV